ncbi:HMA domain-containing protein [Abeliophyllum distichum]|uniref:HMA domain-containing protein n=1 Tax=Abeliophyllum distichum TaxID=126358 RepID=A0ABD1SWE1_9LAMI
MGVSGTLEYLSDLMSNRQKHKKRKQLQTVHLKVRMDCNSCELKVKKALSSLSATSIGNSGSALSPWSSQDFGEPTPQKSGYEILRDGTSTEISGIRKKQKRKKCKSSSSPKSSSSSASRVSKSKSKFVEDQAKPTSIEVA